jgi:hypothetical protein
VRDGAVDHCTFDLVLSSPVDLRSTVSIVDLVAEFEPRTFWESRLRERFSLRGVGYLGAGEAFNACKYEVRRRLFLARVPPLLPQGPIDVLDVGSGTGVYVDLWKGLGARVTGGLERDVGRAPPCRPPRLRVRAG